MTHINKQSIETAKTVLIAVLVSGIIAFVCGMHYQAVQNARLQAARGSALVTVKK